MNNLILVRHGQSLWNKEKRFTGWADIDLTEEGKSEAKRAGELIKKLNIDIDTYFTSKLKRAKNSLKIILKVLDKEKINFIESSALNERHYGSLQGMNKSEMVERHGEDQVMIWRRSYDIPPPPLDDDAYRTFSNQRRFAGIAPTELPRTESLKETVARFIPFWSDEILPHIKNDKKVLICAHGNSLRALVKYLDKISDSDIAKLNIPTGVPLVYELDNNLKPIDHYYLGDQEEVRKATESVAQQIGKKS